MRVQDKQHLTKGKILYFMKKKNQSYGNKFQNFLDRLIEKFEFHQYPLISKEVKDNYLPVVMLLAIIVRKNSELGKTYKEEDFLKQLQYKNDSILKSYSKELDENVYKDMEKLIKHSVKDMEKLKFFTQKFGNYIQILLSIISQGKKKSGGTVDHYSEKEVERIGKHFGESIYFINYDEEKQFPQNLAIKKDAIYVLKAKSYIFILHPKSQIKLLETGNIHYYDVAEIFNLNQESKLNSTQKNLGKSMMTEDEMMQSILFPEQVECDYCKKKYSEFNVINYNYKTYCYDCTIAIDKDVSFIPEEIVKKFLKSKKFSGDKFQLKCYECQCVTYLDDYKPTNKPKRYRCKQCEKMVCVEHQAVSSSCFCYCVKCKEATLTIQNQFLKYCLECGTRFCELCNKKGSGSCGCICKKCHRVDLVDHDCEQSCHNCHNPSMLMNCDCGGKLCPSCFYLNMEPKVMADPICKAKKIQA